MATQVPRVLGNQHLRTSTRSQGSGNSSSTSSVLTANEYQYISSPHSSEERVEYFSAPGSPTPTKTSFQKSQSSSTPTKPNSGRVNERHQASSKLVRPVIPLNFTSRNNISRSTPRTQLTDLQTAASQLQGEQVEVVEATLEVTIFETEIIDLEQDVTQRELGTFDSTAFEDTSPALEPQNTQPEAGTHDSTAHNTTPTILEGFGMQAPAPEFQDAESALGFSYPYFENQFLCWSNLDSRWNIVGVPPKYAQEQREGRVIELRGIPKCVYSTLLIPILKHISKDTVLYDISLTDCNSHAVFRWAVLESREAAINFCQFIRAEQIDWSPWGYGGVEEIFGFPACPAGPTFVGTKDYTTLDLQEEVNSLVGVSLEKKYQADRKRIAQQQAIREQTDREKLARASTTMPPNKQDAPPTQTYQLSDGHENTAKQEGVKVVEEHYTEESVVTSSTRKDSVTAQPTSWAKMAGTVDDNNKTIDLKPENKATSTAPRLKPIGRFSIGERRASQPLVNQMRLVFLMNLPSNITLTDISDGIFEGPLVSIHFNIDPDSGNRYAGVIFQHAEDATAFHRVLRHEHIAKTPERFRFVVDSAISDTVIHTDSIIKMMGPPIYATRRLTIVKKAFFFKMKLTQLRNFCEKYVAHEDIQKVWLYNGGNATVVFAKVEDAIKVKDALDQERDNAEETSHFYDLHTSFSKDPCVQKIHYTTDLV